MMGEDHKQNIIDIIRDSDSTEESLESIRKYCININNVSIIQRTNGPRLYIRCHREGKIPIIGNRIIKCDLQTQIYEPGNSATSVVVIDITKYLNDEYFIDKKLKSIL